MKIVSLSLTAILVAAMSVSAQDSGHAHLASYTTVLPVPGTANRVDDSNYLKPEFINNLNVSAVRDFVKRFNDPDNARWYKMKDGSLLVKFDLPGRAFRVIYDVRGSWIYSIQTYHEKQMLRDVRAIVKSTYYDYSITQVEEINHVEGAGIVYIVHLADDTSYKTVRVCNGEMDELETLYKK